MTIPSRSDLRSGTPKLDIAELFAKIRQSRALASAMRTPLSQTIRRPPTRPELLANDAEPDRHVDGRLLLYTRRCQRQRQISSRILYLFLTIFGFVF